MSSSLQRRFGFLSADDAARLDAAAVAGGVEMVQLMEVAGFQVARCAWQLLGRRHRQVHVVAGHGNNGGDGLVAARHLAAWGCSVTAAVLGAEDSLSSLLRAQLRAAEGAGVDVACSADPGELATAPGAAVVIDALLGTGLHEPPRPAHAAMIEQLSGVVLSIDVPSGLDASSGTAPGAVVTAHTTCTLTAVKRGMWNPGSRRHTGRIVAADIGMPLTAWRHCGLEAPTAVRGGRIVPLPSIA